MTERRAALPPDGEKERAVPEAPDREHTDEQALTAMRAAQPTCARHDEPRGEVIEQSRKMLRR